MYSILAGVGGWREAVESRGKGGAGGGGGEQEGGRSPWGTWKPLLK